MSNIAEEDFTESLKFVGFVDTLRYVCDADLFHRNDVRRDISVLQMEYYYNWVSDKDNEF